MGWTNKKTTSAKDTGTQDKETPPGDEDKIFKGQNLTNSSEEEERRLKELEEELEAKNKELEACQARAREKSLKQRIEEAKDDGQSKEIENESNEVINIDELGSAAKGSQKKVPKNHSPQSTQTPHINQPAIGSMANKVQIQSHPNI